jgi:hypothetical protein
MDDARFEAGLDDALRCAPDVHAPRHFAQRLMTRLPQNPVARPARKWQIPVVAALVLIFCGALTWLAWDMGLGGWLVEPPIFLTLLLVEALAAGTWLWRLVTR